MSFLSRLFGGRADRQSLKPLYDSIVAVSRDPAWYRDGGVADTLDGRFDMLTAITALVLLRLEKEGEAQREASVKLTELFIDDMDSTLRQIGIGDFVVGKHVGRMMGALGGRLGAFRDVAASGESTGDLWEPPVRRNLFHDAPDDARAPQRIAERLAAFNSALADVPATRLIAGEIPSP